MEATLTPPPPPKKKKKKKRKKEKIPDYNKKMYCYYSVLSEGMLQCRPFTSFYFCINLGFIQNTYILDMHCPKKVRIESKSVYGYIVIHNVKLVLMCLIGRAIIIRR